MILPSTMRKLQQQGKPVYKVTLPAWTLTMNGRSVEVPEHGDIICMQSREST